MILGLLVIRMCTHLSGLKAYVSPVPIFEADQIMSATTLHLDILELPHMYSTQ